MRRDRCIVCGKTFRGEPVRVLPGSSLAGSRRVHARCERYLIDEQEAPRLSCRQILKEAALTPAEGKILQRIMAGERNREIAERLGVTEKTVRNTVTRILYKLEVRSRTEAVSLLSRAGWGREDTGGET